MEKVVTRFAPSPTGFMHIGGVRTALFAWLFARKHGGTFILRIEDTDKEREVAGSIDHIIESLQWLGITWDEGVLVEGPHGPYIQSKRLDLYNEYAARLIAAGHAYADPYTEGEVEEMRKKAEAEKRPFLFREHRPTTITAWDGSTALRFKVPEVKRYVWNDLVHGELSAGEEALDDFILIKGDGYPTYNFAHVVDDIEMGVTHVMRAQEFIPSIPKFLSLYDALGVTPPNMAILPPILGADGNKKLSKRDGAKDVLDYRTEGYLPQALVNFLAMIGWNPGTEQEIFSSAELIQAFSISQIQIHGGIFNEEKLRWMNKKHLELLSNDEFRKLLEPFLAEHTELLNGAFSRTAPLTDLRERVQVLGEVSAMATAGDFDFYMKDPLVEVESLVWKKEPSKEAAFRHLTAVADMWSKIPESEFTSESAKAAVMDYAEREGRGSVLWPTRYALSGKDRSPDPFTIAEGIGREAAVRRLHAAGILLNAE